MTLLMATAIANTSEVSPRAVIAFICLLMRLSPAPATEVVCAVAEATVRVLRNCTGSAEALCGVLEPLAALEQPFAAELLDSGFVQ